MMYLVVALGVLFAGQGQIMPSQEDGTLFNLMVTSNTVPNLTSTEALLKEIIKPEMSDEQKAMAVWKVVYQNKFWNPSSRGNLRVELGGTDPIISLNCFSPTICQQDSEMCISLWGLLGYSARMWQLGWHTTPEIWYGGKWRHFDATTGRISRDDKGEITSVALARTERRGKTWMRPNSYISETEGISLGHRMGLTLRKDETFTRYWQPLGKDADYWCATSDGARPDNRERRGRRRLKKAMDITTRRFKPMPDDAAYGNGRWVFQPDFGRKNWRQSVEYAENVAVSESSGMYAGSAVQLHPEEAGSKAYVVFRLRSPYVFSGGWVSGFFDAGSGRDQLDVQASADGGRTWKTLWAKRDSHANNHTIGLRDVIGGKFDCLVKVRMLASGKADDVRVGGLRFETIVMNNPFVLPALKLGKTKVTVATGPQLDTLSIHPCMANSDYRSWIVDESNTIGSWEAALPRWQLGLCSKRSDKESYVVFKVDTPGQLKKLRWGGRFADDNTRSKLYYSFDNKQWQEKPWSYTQRVKETANGRRTHVALYETLKSFPKGTKQIWLKYWFGPNLAEGRGPGLLTPGIRIDADYVPAVRAKRPPVEVTYCWKQYADGKATEKTHTKMIDTYPTEYGIIVKGDKEPTMQWVEVRLKSDAPTTQPAAE